MSGKLSQAYNHYCNLWNVCLHGRARQFCPTKYGTLVCKSLVSKSAVVIQHSPLQYTASIQYLWLEVEVYVCSPFLWFVCKLGHLMNIS